MKKVTDKAKSAIVSHSAENVMQKFLWAFAAFCIAAVLIMFDPTANQNFAAFGVMLVIPSFIVAIFFYLQLLKLRLTINRSTNDPFAEEADPNAIEKALAAKQNKKNSD